MLRVIFTLTVLLSFISNVEAQQFPEPDPSLWNEVFNPSGDLIVPVVAYDPGTGIVSVDTRGFDRQRNTTDPNLIANDDVGLISIVLGSGIAFNLLELAGFLPNPEIGGAVLWDSNFLLKPNVFGVPVGGDFLEPGVWNVFDVGQGWSVDEFGVVEMAVNFEPSAPGSVMFGSVQLVPEPTNVWPLLFAVALMFRNFRRYAVG